MIKARKCAIGVRIGIVNTSAASRTKRTRRPMKTIKPNIPRRMWVMVMGLVGFLLDSAMVRLVQVGTWVSRVVLDGGWYSSVWRMVQRIFKR